MTLPKGTEAGFNPPAPSKRSSKETKRSLIAVGVTVAIAVFIFGFLLTDVIDYETLFDVLKSLELRDYLIMLAAGLFLYIPKEGALYASPMPDVGLRRRQISKGQLPDPFLLPTSSASRAA